MRSKTFLVIGAGMMGRAVALDLARSNGVDRVIVADVDKDHATRIASSLPGRKAEAVGLDAGDHQQVVAQMRRAVCTVGAASYTLNVRLTRAAIEAGSSYCDLGGNDAVVEEQRSLDGQAKKAGVLIVPNCGLAPGMANVLAARGAEEFSSVDSIRIRVGGLPVHPRPPFNYQLVFAPEGLLNEYSGRSVVLRDGAITSVEAMTGVEPLSFPPRFPELEAFHTSGGASRLPQMFEGKVRELDYKTIRYPGHCEKMKILLDLGFGSLDPVQLGNKVFTERELFLQLLAKKLPSGGPDVVLVRVEIEGKAEGWKKMEMEVVDFADESDNISAMMRTTAYPTSLIAQFIAGSIIEPKGVQTPEECVPLEPFITGLRARGIDVRRSTSGTAAG